MKRSHRLIVPAVLSVAVIGQGVIDGCSNGATPTRDAAFVQHDANDGDATRLDAARDAGLDAEVVDAGVSDTLVNDALVDAALPDTPA